MKNLIILKSIIFFFIIAVSCNKKIIVSATKDAALSSQLPNKNISGKNEVINGKGYGTRKKQNDGFVTYPTMYLYSGKEDSIKESFIVGGFNIPEINGEIIHASLKFFINYSSTIRKNICIFVRPILKDWDEENITYLDVYEDTNMFSDLKTIVESNDEKCYLIVFSVNNNNIEDLNSIPFSNAKKTVSINVTGTVKLWFDNPLRNHGFLIDPMWVDDSRYVTTNEYNEISDFGIIEIATTEWFYWDGKVPEEFYLEKYEWKGIRNKALNKIKFIPRLEILYK